MSAVSFSAVVGLDEAKLALLLAGCQPRLGGVLLRGQKGSGKTTLARGLATLLPGDAPFVELPLGATEDRVIGSIDAAELLTSGEARVRPGLLAAADGGVLYVDEINLLADHLVDALLDAAVSGINRIERDGISHEHPARFVLIGSMNPEEGELRPQLLDRFGLAADIVAPDRVADRVSAVERQLDLDRTGSIENFASLDDDLRQRLSEWTEATVPPDVMELASRVALEVGAEGLRADLMLCRAAAALAGWEGRNEATSDTLRRVAPLVLAHRRRRQPFDDHGMDADDLDDAFEQAADPSWTAPNEREEVVDPDAERQARLGNVPRNVATSPTTHAGRRAPTPEQRGRFVRAEAAASDSDLDGLAIAATANAVAARRAADPGGPLDPEDLRQAVREGRTSSLVVIAVDTSASMGTDNRIAAAKAAVLGLLTDAYQQRDRVALIAFRGDDAELVLRPTGSVEVARSRLTELPIGGATPLAAGIDAVRDLVERMTRDRTVIPVVVLITDGRATSTKIPNGDPTNEAKAAATQLAALGARTMVIDAEDGTPRLGLARELAAILEAECVSLAHLEPAAIPEAIRRLS